MKLNCTHITVLACILRTKTKFGSLLISLDSPFIKTCLCSKQCSSSMKYRMAQTYHYPWHHANVFCRDKSCANNNFF